MKKTNPFFFSVFTLSSFGQNIEGNWKFDFILPDTLEIGENLCSISENDEMIIYEDGSFDYEIQQINLKVSRKLGITRWFTFFKLSSPKDINRLYKISVLDNSLVLNENGINYFFNRIELNHLLVFLYPLF